MKNYKYLIIGGGMTADSAVGGIREVDRRGSIGIISSETDAPYNRPPLTKGLWKGDSLNGIWRKTERKGVHLHLRRTVKKIDPRKKRVVDDHGEVFIYEKLLLATGGRPRLLPFGVDTIIYYRTVADYRRLRDLTKKGQRFAVIGSGFIGSEIAAGLAMNEKDVVMIFPGKGIGERMFPPALSRFVSGYYLKKGVKLLAGKKVSGLEKRGEQVVLKIRGGRNIVVDAVVAGLGIEPNVELAKAMRLKVEDGVVVDEFLLTSQPDIYAAGDVAAFFNPALGKRMRVEHEDNANSMGQVAGRNMAGKPEPYYHLPYFYSDLFELGYEAVGETDARLETFADWVKPNKKGVVYYLKSGRVRGALLWNVFGKVDAARGLIAGKEKFSRGELKGRIR
jgi:3-phenylpropionate/trans-cinnamate dioxygenase ferredoxin reductase subunit